MESEAQRFGANFKHFRTRKGLSQRDVARLLKIHRGLISNIEHGKTNPTLATITKLAKVVGISPDKLLK